MPNQNNSNPTSSIQTGVEISPKTGVLGTFHDNTRDLPSFYKYREVSLGDMKNMLPKLEDVQNGMNGLFIHEDAYHITFDSSSHVVLELKKLNGHKTYFFHSFYSNEGDNDVKPTELMPGKSSSTATNTTPPNDINKEKKVASVLTTQISSCGFQIAFIGPKSGEAQYLVISHLQNRSKLTAILRELTKQLMGDKTKQSMSLVVQSAMAIMAATKDGIADANFDLSPLAQQHSVILMRDHYYWPSSDCMCLGFGINRVGLLFNNDQFRLFMNPIYNNLFTSTPYFDIQNLPIFNSTPDNVRAAIAGLPRRSIDTIAPGSPCATRISTSNDIIKNYYWTCFKSGYFGDYTYITEILSKLRKEEVDAVETAFYQHYRGYSLDFVDKTVFKTHFGFSKSKWIVWDDFISPAAFTEGAKQYTVKNNYFLDMLKESIAGSNDTIQSILSIQQA